MIFFPLRCIKGSLEYVKHLVINYCCWKEHEVENDRSARSHSLQEHSNSKECWNSITPYIKEVSSLWVPWSNSCPNGDDVPVLLAYLPSIASIV